MKKNLTITSIIIAIIFGIIFLPKIYNRLKSEKVVDSSRTKEVSNDSKLAFVKLNGEARKVPDFIFKNQDNLYVSNEDYNGKVYVAEFFFTTCPLICVEMNQNMKILDEEFGDRKDFGIASFTIDPINDTPVVLKEYAERLRVKSKNWHFLTGEIDSVYELSNSGCLLYTSPSPRDRG